MSFLETTASKLSLVERKILIQAIERKPTLSKFNADKYKTLEMCEIDVEEDPYLLEFVFMDLITQEMCNKVVKKCSRSLIYVSDCYVRI